ncbi:MAG: DUF6463 family protein [Acidobacteriota bacterium]
MSEVYVVRLILLPLFLLCALVVFYLRKRKAARLLTVIGALHILGGIWVGRSTLARIFRDGFIGEADSFLGHLPARTEKELVFWFLFWGMLMMLLGQLISWIEKQGMRPPAFIGWELMASSLVAALLMPAVGFWLVLLPAFMLIREAKDPAKKNEPSSSQMEES